MRSLIISIFLFGCALSVYGQRQGIIGKVFYLSGNYMPGPGKTNSKPSVAVKEIHVYKVAYLKGVEKSGVFFTKINTELVAKVNSNTDGSFSIKLPPGEYSVFVKEPQGLFANLFDQEGKINSVVVRPKKYSQIEIKVDFDAAY